MNPQPLAYPATPVNVPESVTRPSAAFRSEVTRVMASIILFFIVYLVLIVLAIGLAAAAVYGGIALIVAMRSFFGLMLGIGVISLGVMVLFFLVKFIFAVSRYDHSGSIEITEADHPRLFQFIRRLTSDTQTPFPKRIFLSPEVNAAVFYNSGFWSMFLPVKKNLQIGLGLVNSVNLSEFKAVMAHEFGHFSQRSMKLGSFVYNVNRVIYNMLFENTGYSRGLQTWAEISGYFAIFAGLTAQIARAIQWVLRHIYSLINKSYMGLSREMEFHADAVAASVSGSDNCISALRRIELADACYGTVIDKCNILLKEKLVIGNVYESQQVIFRQYAGEFKLGMHRGLPVVSGNFMAALNPNRVNFRDQWASHPGMDERTERLAALQVNADTSHETAWVLFDDPEVWQQQLTGKVYSNVDTQDLRTLDKSGFERQLQEEKLKFALPGEYNGFYDKRPLSAMDVEELSRQASTTIPGPDEFHSIFNQDNAGIHKKMAALGTDIQVLNAIADKQIKTKTFDFDGEKFPAAQARFIALQLQQELDALKELQLSLDKQAYKFCYARALQNNPDKALQIRNGYLEFFELEKQSQEFLQNANHMMGILEPLFTSGSMTVEEALKMVERLKDAEEIFKAQLKNWLAIGAFNHRPNVKERARNYLDRSYAYFSGDSFFENELNELNVVVNESWEEIRVFLFAKFKSLLILQLS